MDKALLRKALKAYGPYCQTIKSIEEMAELTVALSKQAFGGATSSVIDEIADVLIMTNQLKLIYGEAEVDERVKFKIERLRQRLSQT